ncbi:MAG: alpha/beta hydrolase [Candidatus Bipolaricaulia bacterium]
MPKVHANGIEIYYEVHGPAGGEPLVLIAGLGYDHWMWHKMVPGLAEHLRVIVFDNRGVGKTDRPPGPYTAQLLAEDTAGLLRALGVDCAAILGHSMGGFVAQALVLSRPELVSKLILASTNFGGPRHIPITQEAMAVLTDMSGDPIERLRRGIVISTAPGFAERQPELVREWLDYRVRNPLDPASYQAQMAIGLALLSEAASFEKKLGAVRVPTLILFGEHDKVVPPGNAELLAKALPNSRVRILSNAGHFFPLEAPEAAIEAILEFLEARA